MNNSKEYYDVGERIKFYRKLKKLSLSEFGDLIGKTKSTVCRYETGEICPDVITLCEICDALELSISEFLDKEKKEAEEYSINPFKSNELYLYYIGFSKKLVTSKIEISLIDGMQKVILKNAINRYDVERNSYMYDGKMESNGIVTFFNLSNSVNNKKFEKIQITINNQFEENGYFYGSITATGNDNLSTNRKCMICRKNADELSKDKKKEIFEKLKISKKEIDQIKKNFYWDPIIRNESDYSVDVEE